MRGILVIRKIGITLSKAKMVKTLCLPYLSESLPAMGAEKMVTVPPTMYTSCLCHSLKPTLNSMNGFKNGMITKCPSINVADKAKAVKFSLLPRILRSICIGFSFSANKCSVMGCMKRAMDGMMMMPKAPMKKKGACQLKVSAKKSERGTPTIEATEKAVNKKPMACPRLS